MPKKFDIKDSPPEQYPYGIKSWWDFQHYKHRRPPWIRLYRQLLDDPEWNALDGDASKMLVMCWLLASENFGYLPTLTKMSFRFRMRVEEILSILSRLSHWIEMRCEHHASTMLATRYHDATPDNTDNTDTDTLCPNGSGSDNKKKLSRNKTAYSADFEEFWKSYPDRRNNSKTNAFAEWRKLSEEDRLSAKESLVNFSNYCRRNSDYRVLHCERYLKYRRFEGWAMPEEMVAPAAVAKTGGGFA